MKRRYVWPLALATLSIAASLFTKDWFSGFSNNFAAGFVGSLLTVLLIDRAIESARQQDVARIKAAAYTRLRPKLISHLTFLFNIHKASATTPPMVPPTSFDDIFNEDYFTTIRHLDMSKPAPVNPPVSWFEFASYNMRDFTASLDRMLDAYVSVLSPDDIEAVEAVQTSVIIAAVSQFQFLYENARREGSFLPPRFFGHDSMISEMRRYVAAFLALLQTFNGAANGKVAVTDLPLWREDVSPGIGSARDNALN